MTEPAGRGVDDGLAGPTRGRGCGVWDGEEGWGGRPSQGPGRRVPSSYTLGKPPSWKLSEFRISVSKLPPHCRSRLWSFPPYDLNVGGTEIDRNSKERQPPNVRADDRLSRTWRTKGFAFGPVPTCQHPPTPAVLRRETSVSEAKGPDLSVTHVRTGFGVKGLKRVGDKSKKVSVLRVETCWVRKDRTSGDREGTTPLL